MTSSQFELDSNPLISDEKKTNHSSKKYDWYWAPVYCAVWFLLFYIAVIPSQHSYPEKLLISNEVQHPDEFIGERAELQLLGLAKIGPKLTGSIENEVIALNYLLHEIELIKQQARKDLYDIEVDVDRCSGHFMLWGMACIYRNVTNIMVKISERNSQSDSYLLVNSHFDSEVLSPGAADAGVMVVVMLETLRVISRSEKPLKNPVVFLLNGAEEANLLASHGFITQHQWAEKCKAVINLDSAGSGGKETLFQSGPKHPWLMKYYKKSAPHPNANTMAEELFQNNFIPSDSDYRIFRDYGHIPGVDMAYSLNGYVYHTKYDKFENVIAGTYQNTGDNVLALTRALANANELHNTSAHEDGHVIFYDYLGWFLIFYTQNQGVAINVVVCISSVIVICISVFLMGRQSHPSDGQLKTWLRFLIIFTVQLFAVAVGFALTFLIAVVLEGLGLSQSWYTGNWIIFGLYFCPMFFGMTIVPAFHIKFTKAQTYMALNDTIACYMHSHCIILALICIILTGMGIRSSYFTMVAVFSYTISVLLILLSRLWIKNHDWSMPIHLICQLLPFWFYTYLHMTSMNTFVPMQGRDGPTSNAEMLIAGFTGMMAMHFAGFILPILHKFRKSKLFCSLFAVLAIIFIIIAATPAAFPYVAHTSPQRFYVLHVHRRINAVNGSVEIDESGIYIQPVDTRYNSLQDTTFKDALPPSWTKEQCSKYIYCGLPLYNTRWMKWKDSAKWIPADKPNIIVPTDLKLISRSKPKPQKVRLQFRLKSADRAVIYVQPLDVNVTAWTFDSTPLDEDYETPYFIYYADSMVEAPLDFFIEFESDHPIADNDKLVLLGIGVHFQYHENTYTNKFKEFLTTFPAWTYPTHWTAAFESSYF